MRKCSACRAGITGKGEWKMREKGMLRAAALNLRAWKIWWRTDRGFFIAAGLHETASALVPYTGIFMASLIVSELAGACRPQRLMRLVMLTLLLSAGIRLAEALLHRWAEVEKATVSRLDQKLYMEKMARLDYSDIDRQDVWALYSTIMQNKNWAEWGIYRTLQLYTDSVKSLVRILAGALLSVSLFTSSVPAGSQAAFVNSPLILVLMICICAGVMWSSAVLRSRFYRYYTDYEKEARLGNRIFTYFGRVSFDRKRAEDMRLYDQYRNVCVPYLRGCTLFGPDSTLARAARGLMGLDTALIGALSVVFTALVYLYAGLKAWGGAFDLGALTRYAGSASQLFEGFSMISFVMSIIRGNTGFLEKEYSFLDIPNSMYQGSLTTEKRADRQYDIEFRDVSFRYPGREEWALRHVNMKFRVGSRLAIVGKNGSGKTTFIKLLTRLYDPTEGVILLNGIDIRKYRYDEYIALFSVVFQDFQLFSLPLGQNVAGEAAYDRQKVMDCLQKAGFEMKEDVFTCGIDTPLYHVLDEKGVQISGGEAQKIAIARALYHDAPFVVLDEPTAALDPYSEAEIYSRFDEIVTDRTAVYISHRLSSCRFCDEIAVFDGGRIAEQGTHEELLEKGGKYAELWHAQAQYYES